MAAHQAPPSLGFSRQEHWSGLPFPSPVHESGKWKVKMKVKLLSRVRLLATPWTAAHQAPPSMGFARQEYWSPPTWPKTSVWFGFSLSLGLDPPLPPYTPNLPHCVKIIAAFRLFWELLSLFLPQGSCTWNSLCRECSLLWSSTVCSYSSFKPVSISSP